MDLTAVTIPLFTSSYTRYVTLSGFSSHMLPFRFHLVFSTRLLTGTQKIQDKKLKPLNFISNENIEQYLTTQNIT